MPKATGPIVHSGAPSGAPVLVLVHGVGLDHTMWDLVVDGLSEHYRIVRYDLLGHGQTIDPPGQRTIEDFVDQLLSVIDSLDEPPIVAGLSLGGLVAMAAAARYPDRFAAVAALNTVFGATDEMRAAARQRLAITEELGLEPIAALAIDRWFTSDWQTANPAAVDVVRTRLTTTDLDGYLKAYRVFVTGDPLMPEAAADITCPVFAMTGSNDPGSTPAMTEAIAAAVPNGRAKILDGLHHVPPIEDPDRFSNALTEGLFSCTERVTT